MIVSLLKKYIWVINLILIAGLSYSIAQIVSDRIKEKISLPFADSNPASNAIPEDWNANSRPNQIFSRNSYKVILQRNIFGLRNTSLGSSGLNPNSVPQTTLNLELLGTALKSGEKSTAVIKNLDNSKVRGYSQGEVIDIITSESVKLGKVDHCIAIVERSDGPETIKCKKDTGDVFSPVGSQPKSTWSHGPVGGRAQRGAKEKVSTQNLAALQGGEDGIKEVAEGTYEIDQKMLNDALSDTNQLLTQARAIPQEDGLKFFSIRPNSIFFKIGIRSGDVVHRINNIELDNIENAFSVFQELRQQSSFSIDLTRGGQDLMYQYTVK
jgi:type II secretory pathway component PulC